MIKNFEFKWLTGKYHQKGGEGSGYHGHAGRPGSIGGSAPSSGGTTSSSGSVRSVVVSPLAVDDRQRIRKEVSSNHEDVTRNKKKLEHPEKWSEDAMKDLRQKVVVTEATNLTLRTILDIDSIKEDIVRNRKKLEQPERWSKEGLSSIESRISSLEEQLVSANRDLISSVNKAGGSNIEQTLARLLGSKHFQIES